MLFYVANTGPDHRRILLQTQHPVVATFGSKTAPGRCRTIALKQRRVATASGIKTNARPLPHRNSGATPSRGRLAIVFVLCCQDSARRRPLYCSTTMPDIGSFWFQNNARPLPHYNCTPAPGRVASRSMLFYVVKTAPDRGRILVQKQRPIAVIVVPTQRSAVAALQLHTNARSCRLAIGAVLCCQHRARSLPNY